jgi:internalin A
MSTHTQLQALLNSPLQATPLQGRDPAWAVMPCLHNPDKSKAKSAPWQALFLENNGRLTGLNLAGRGLNDADWAKIHPLLDLENLEALNLRDNKLTQLPGLERMNKLQYLDLCNNQLEDLQFPPAAENLKHVFLSGNPHLKNPPPEVVARGRFAIVDFLQKLKAGSKKVYEAKVLILGAGGAGKTSLRRRLIQGFGVPMPTKEESTHGVEVEDHTFKTNGAEDFTAHFWDFGGQEVYHATHQFFLTTRSLYLIVTDGRREDNINYWLQLARLMGGDSPVFIVQNLNGEHSGVDFSLPEMQKFPQVKLPAYSFDLSVDQKGLQKLYEDLETELRRLPHVGSPWPKTWVQIREGLKSIQHQEQKPHVSLERYLELCEKCEENEEEALNASQFLHDLGSILHFQDDKENTLYKTLILDSKWATDGVYRVLDSELIKKQKGYFRKAQAEEIWKNSEKSQGFQRSIGDLLALMLKFKICYELKRDKEKAYLAPQLLDNHPTTRANEWKEEGTLQLRYKYDFKPKGMVSRLIVDLHDLIENYETQAWRNGAIFAQGRNELKLTEDDTTLYLRAKGPEAKALLIIVSRGIELLNDSYEEFKTNKKAVQKLVPCICVECLVDEDPYLHVFEDLKNIKAKGRKTTAECKKSSLDVDLDELMETVSNEGGIKSRLNPKRIRELIANNKLEEALNAWPEETDELVNFKARLSALEAKKMNRQINDDTYEADLGNLRGAVLTYLNECEKAQG